MNKPDFDDVIKNKPASSYSKKIMDEIMLLSIDKDSIKPIGSYSYKVQKYPGDIDLLETIERFSKKDTINAFINGIQHISNEIAIKRMHYFMEIKCGIDFRYLFKPGYLHNGKLHFDPDFEEKINKLHKRKLLSKIEMKTIREVMEIPNQYCYEVINNILRKHYIVRWSYPEIIKGMKILPGNVKLTLGNAVTHNSKINLEAVIIVNGKLTEISNFFILSYFDDDGKLMMINLPQMAVTDFNSYVINGLEESIEDLYFSILNYNPFKMVKRMWSLGKFTKNEKLINKLLPIISGDIALTSQLKSDFSTLVKVLINIKKPPVQTILNELSDLKGRLTFVYELNQSEHFLDEKLDSLIANYKKLGPIDVAAELEKIVEILQDIINEKTIEYLEKVNLAPPPSNLLPLVEQYN